MALPEPTLRQLLEAGVHFGHQKHRWNPKMAPYLFGIHHGIHITDLTQTVVLLREAMQAVRECIASGGRILFVGTKPQATQLIKDAASNCAQYYINHRWFGGTLTNWKAISKSVRRLAYLKEFLDNEGRALLKKERLKLTREQEKLERAIGGISTMPALPDLLFVIDSNKEAIAVREACKLGIPVVAIIDSNSNPDGIAYPIPGNDDARRAIALYCDLMSRAVLEGISDLEISSGKDIGAAENIEAISIEESDEEPILDDNAAQDNPQLNGAEETAHDDHHPVAIEPEANPSTITA